MQTISPKKKTTKTSYTKKRRALLPQSRPLRLVMAALIVLLGLALLLLAWKLREPQRPPIENAQVVALAKVKTPRWIEKDLLPLEASSRRGVYLEEVGGIVVHYVGNPGTSAAQNRSFYGQEGVEVNSHFLIDLDGGILQCLPLEEKSSASSQRNRDTISIEVCHPDEEGGFTQESYDSLLRLLTWLCQEADLRPEQVIRHFDVTGKACPIYYVNNPEAWNQLQQELTATLAAE